ncbi:MAG: hypothetical protein EOP86_24385 [Verrucomicrobiaceae bacterium]|nr:MAG: hypothetical protein EOP86_24385 [Verrucomicrobiaceae bacterium]
MEKLESRHKNIAKAALDYLGRSMHGLAVYFPGQEVTGFSGQASIAQAAEFFKAPLTGHKWALLRSDIGRMVREMRQIVDFLRKLNQWEAVHSNSTALSAEETGELVREYEELIALTDLLEREVAVTATLAVAREDLNWQAPEKLFCGLQERTKDRVRDQRDYLAKAKRRLEECGLAIDRLEGGGEGTASGIKPHAAPAVIPFLDEVGQLFSLEYKSGNTAEVRFGARIAQALMENLPLEFQGKEIKGAVGQRGQLTALLAELQAALEALEELETRPSDYPDDLAKFADSLLSYESALLRADAQERHTVQAFQDKISGGLADALNELTALMTPARWAYGDLAASLQLDGESRRVELITGAVPAALTLNTAELNTMTLALFLLCGIQKENPLRMIVLDDPFQNMDELSVTTVSRGLARLMRVWGGLNAGHGWRIILMLHGEENVERVRAEAPCAAYFLPWLTPGLPREDKAKITIDSEPSRFDQNFISLGEAIEAAKLE